ncbi:hypothetical protein LOAG_12638 [Loa loa]|uniref:Uncharacterized protein n=1 Tax=Loa loa TaxID=7209 RepID=A0A1S0TLC5_LOALO|nr:hypothetical protein LOAG_12638 [Loa loa]EFO15869.2 hypothetical protein LOAG_12638 [Loa loa]
MELDHNQNKQASVTDGTALQPKSANTLDRSGLDRNQNNAVLVYKWNWISSSSCDPVHNQNKQASVTDGTASQPKSANVLDRSGLDRNQNNAVLVYKLELELEIAI